MWWEANLFCGMDSMLENQMLIESAAIIGVGGWGFRGVDRGTQDRSVKPQPDCITIPGIGRHLVSTGR